MAAAQKVIPPSKPSPTRSSATTATKPQQLQQCSFDEASLLERERALLKYLQMITFIKINLTKKLSSYLFYLQKSDDHHLGCLEDGSKVPILVHLLLQLAFMTFDVIFGRFHDAELLVQRPQLVLGLLNNLSNFNLASDLS